MLFHCCMKEIKNKTVLLLTPAFTTQGGIVNYFKVLNGKFTIPVEYFTRGARNWPNRDGKLAELKRAFKDLLVFRRKIKTGKFGLVQSSTSLGSFSVIRDAFFLSFAQKTGLKTIAFFRGWDENYERTLTGFKLRLFKRVFFKCDALIVVSQKFKTKLINWGYEGKIHIETTIVDEALLSGLKDNYIEKKVRQDASKRIKLLFLARTEIAKGLYETIDAFSILVKGEPKTYFLTVAGDGAELQNAKEKVEELEISEDVEFVGYIGGVDKSKTFAESDIYIFPSYSEGMPNSVLEAMAFGLPIITTPVGGITDFFEDGVTGFLINNNNGTTIASLVERLLLDRDTFNNAIRNNFEFAQRSFLSTVVVKRLENIYNEYI